MGETLEYRQHNEDGLTAGVVAVHEGLLTKRIHVDQEVLLGDHLLVPGVDSLVDELRKIGPDDDPHAVDDVLARPLLHLLLGREVVVDLRVFSGKLEQVLHRQRLVVRDAEMLDLGIFDDLHKDQTQKRKDLRVFRRKSDHECDKM